MIIWYRSINGSAHAVVVGAFKNLDLDRKIEVHGWIFNLHHQNLSNRVFCRHRALVVHVLFQLHVHEKLCVRLAVHKVLYDDIIRALGEVFIGDGLNLHREVVVWHVFERDGRHADLVFFRWDFDHWSVFVDFVKLFEADDFWDFAGGDDRDNHRFCVFELDLKESIDFVVLPDGGDFGGDFEQGPFPHSDFEPDFFKIFIALVASDWEHVLFKVVELLVETPGNDPEEERVIGRVWL